MTSIHCTLTVSIALARRYACTELAVGREHASGHHWVRSTRGFGTKVANEVERLEDDVSRPIALRGLQFVTQAAIAGVRQPLFRGGRTANVPAQPFDLSSLVRAGRDTSV